MSASSSSSSSSIACTPTSAKESDQRVAKQNQLITRWVNHYLAPFDQTVTDLASDFRDGLRLKTLLEVLSGEKIPKWRQSTRRQSEVQRLDSLMQVFDFMKTLKISLVNIGASDLEKGNVKMTMAVLWTLLHHFQLARNIKRAAASSSSSSTSSSSESDSSAASDSSSAHATSTANDDGSTTNTSATTADSNSSSSSGRTATLLNSRRKASTTNTSAPATPKSGAIDAAADVRAQLMMWVNDKLAPYAIDPITDFTLCFRDGRVLLALTHALLVVDTTADAAMNSGSSTNESDDAAATPALFTLDGEGKRVIKSTGDAVRDIETAFQRAQLELKPGIPTLLDASDVADSPQEDHIMAYVSFFVDHERVAQIERERVAAEKAEQARIAAEKAEQERIEAEKAEQERIAAEKAEQERIATEKAEQERIAAEKAEQERIAAEKAEQERIAAEKAEQERIAAEKAEQERIAAEKAEQDRLAAEKAEQERLAAEQAEAERVAAEKAEAEHIAAEAEAARIAAEHAEAERVAAEKVEAERIAAEKAEQERIAAEAEAARITAEKAEEERLVAKQAEAARIAAEHAEAERIAAELAEAERIALEKAEADHIAAEKAEAERVAAEMAEAERIAAEEAEQERVAAEKAGQERIAAEQAEAERIAAEKADADRIAVEKAEAERVAVEKAEAERVAVEQAAAEKAAAEKAEAERKSREAMLAAEEHAAFLSSAGSSAIDPHDSVQLEDAELDHLLADVELAQFHEASRSGTRDHDHSEHAPASATVLASATSVPSSKSQSATTSPQLKSSTAVSRQPSKLSNGNSATASFAKLHSKESLLEATFKKKTRHGITRWHNRFFAFTGSSLSYWRSESDRNAASPPSQTFAMNEIRSIEQAESNLTIHFHSASVLPLELQAPNDVAANIWYTGINHFISPSYA